MVFPPTQERFQKPACLIFFMRPRSLPSEKTLFPSKTTSFTRALGPSSMVKETWVPAPPILFESCLTVGKGLPFWASISLMIPSTWRALAGS